MELLREDLSKVEAVRWAGLNQLSKQGGVYVAPNNSLNRSADSAAFIRQIEGLIQYFPPG